MKTIIAMLLTFICFVVYLNTNYSPFMGITFLLLVTTWVTYNVEKEVKNEKKQK
jgi:uncharacterized membrane protein YesL